MSAGRHINHLKQTEIRAKLESGELDVARDGGWWCNTCNHITEVDCDGPQNECVICGSVRLKAMEPTGEPLSRMAGELRVLQPEEVNRAEQFRKQVECIGPRLAAEVKTPLHGERDGTGKFKTKSWRDRPVWEKPPETAAEAAARHARFDALRAACG